MKKIVKPILLVLIGALVILQFFRGTPPEVRIENPEDLIANEIVSAEVATLLRSACYDCHSMESKYPWYSYVTPVSWFMYGHIRHAREELNFSNWTTMSEKRQLHKLEEISEEVMEGEMPLPSYTPMHPEAKLTKEQREMISDWAKGLMEN